MAQTAKQRYDDLAPKRNPYLIRARDAAKLTIPYLFPPEGANGSTKLPTPYQSIGARGVKNLASKLLLALFPPNASCFRYRVTNKLQLEEEAQTEIDNALSKVETEVMDEFESRALRPTLSEAKKQLLVAGNVMLFLKEEGLKAFHLDRYVVKRDSMGIPLEMIVRESVAPSTLDPKIRAACNISEYVTEKNEDVDLYTHITRTLERWEIYQELNMVRVPGSDGTYPLDECPWIPLRFNKVDGEDYGRGYVEEYIGDLISAEELTKAIVQGSAAAAKILIFVDPNGITKARAITNAENLDVLSGNAADVTILQMEKFADFRVALETLDRIEGRLSFAFMLNSAIQRNGERVTAEEIRYMAGELEDALGGTYSLLSQEEQLPLIKALVAQMRRKGQLPTLPKDTVKLTIITGLEALGRNHDLEKLRALLEYLQPLGPEVISKIIKLNNYVKRLGTALSINTKDLVKSEEEMSQEQAMEQQMAMIQQFGPEFIRQQGNNSGEAPAPQA